MESGSAALHTLSGDNQRGGNQMSLESQHGHLASTAGKWKSGFSHQSSRGMARKGHQKKVKVKVQAFDPGPLQNPEKYGEFSMEASSNDDPNGESALTDHEGESDTESEEESTDLRTGEEESTDSKELTFDEAKDKLSDSEENPEETETWGLQVADAGESKVSSTEKVLPQRLEYMRNGGFIDFRRLRDWEEVRDVVRDLGDNIGSRQISHALGALKFCSPRPSNEFLEEMADIAVRNVKQLNPMDLSTVLHAYAKMKFVYKPLISTWDNELTDPEMLEACTDIDISTIAYSAGVLNREMVWGLSGRARDQAQGFSRTFVKMLSEEAAHPLRVQHYSETMLSNTYYGLALLKSQEHQALNKLLEEATLPMLLPKFTAQNLSSFIYSMGVAVHRNDAVLRTFLSAVLERIDECSEQGLSNIVYSLGQLKFTDRETLKPLWPTICLPDRLMAFTEQDLSNIVHGLGMLGINDESVLGPVKEELLRDGRLQEFRERGLTGMLYALGQIRHSDMTLLRAIVKELTGSRLKACKPQGLAVTMYSLGILKYTNMKDLNPIFYEVSQPQRVSTFSEQELMNVIYGLGHLRHRDEDILLPLAEEATSPHRLRSFTQQAVATIVHTFANLGFRHRHFLDKIAIEVSKPGRLSDFSEQSLVLTIAAFVRLGHFDKVLFSTFLDECLSPKRKITMRMNPFADTMFGCLKSDAYDVDKFQEIIEVFRDPDKLALANIFPLARMLLACGQLGLRDDEFLKNIRTEILKPERVENLSSDDKRDLGRGFERLGWFDDELIKVLDYPESGRGMGSFRRPQPRGGDGADEGDVEYSSDYVREGDPESSDEKGERRRSGRGVGRGRGSVNNWQTNQNSYSRGVSNRYERQNNRYERQWSEDSSDEESHDSSALRGNRSRSRYSHQQMDGHDDRASSYRDGQQRRGPRSGYFLNEDEKGGYGRQRSGVSSRKSRWSDDDENSDDEWRASERSSRSRKESGEESWTRAKGKRVSSREAVAGWKSEENDDDDDDDEYLVQSSS